MCFPFVSVGNSLHVLPLVLVISGARRAQASFIVFTLCGLLGRTLSLSFFHATMLLVVSGGSRLVEICPHDLGVLLLLLFMSIKLQLWVQSSVQKLRSH